MFLQICYLFVWDFKKFILAQCCGSFNYLNIYFLQSLDSCRWIFYNLCPTMGFGSARLIFSNKINRNKWEFNNGHSTRWLFLPTVSRSNWNLECWFLWREENWKHPEKNSLSKEKNQQETHPHVMPYWVIVVVGECSHHCAIPSPLL